MSTIAIEDGPEVSGEDMGQEISAAATSHALFIIPTRWGGGFTASIHGHLLELADPADHRLAPSPDDPHRLGCLRLSMVCAEVPSHPGAARRRKRLREVANDRGPAESGRHHSDRHGVDTRRGSEWGAGGCLREQPPGTSCRASRPHLGGGVTVVASLEDSPIVSYATTSDWAGVSADSSRLRPRNPCSTTKPDS
jgi:hypothetical protein